MSLRALPALLLLALPLSIAPAWCADLEGTVRDEAGAPLAGVRVDLCLYDHDADERSITVCASTTTGADGAFLLAAPPEAGSSMDSACFLVAYREDRGIVGETIRFFRGEEVDLEMPPPCSVSGRVVASDGTPVPGASVALRSASRRGLGGYLAVIPPDLQGRFRTTAGDDGQFTIAGLPQGWVTRLTIETAGLGTIEVGGLADGADVRFPLPGSLTVRVVGPFDPAEQAGLRLSFHGREGVGPNCLARATVTLGPDGVGAIAALPSGVYHCVPQAQVGTAHHVRGMFDIEVPPGRETVLELPAEEVLRLRGRVVAGDTGEPIAGATGQAYITGPTVIYTSNLGPTGPDGRFDIPMLPGEFYFSIMPPPEDLGVRLTWYQEAAVLPAGGADLGDLALDRLYRVPVEVRDASGEPVVGAVVGWTSVEDDLGADAAAATTDETGHALVEGLRGRTELYAKTEGHSSPAVEVDVDGDRDEPVVVTLHADPVCRLTARVRGDDGNLVPGAKVSCELLGGNRGWWEPLDLSPDGTAVFAQAVQASRGRMCASAPNHYSAESPWVDLVAGGDVDCGTLTLRAFRGQVRGVAVDGAGNPVAGVEVTAYVGIGGSPVISTGPDGRFALGPLPEGRAVLLVEAPDGPPALVAASTGEETTVRMPATVAVVPELGDTERRAIARGVLMSALDAPGGHPDERTHARLLSLLTRTDPDEALRRCLGGTPTAVSIELARASLASDFEEAVAELRAAHIPDEAAELLIEEGRARLRSDPSGAARCLNASIEFLEQSSEAEIRVALLAQVGGLLARLGEETGVRLLRRVETQITAMPTAEWPGFVRGMAAAQLAEIDPDSALALVEPISDPDLRPRILATVARHLARTEPDRAVALLARIEDEWGRDQAIAQCVPFFAPERLLEAGHEPGQPSAVELARTIVHPGARAEAFGRIAAMAPPESCDGLLGEAFEALRANLRGTVAQQVAGETAGLAGLARHLGSPLAGRLLAEAIRMNVEDDSVDMDRQMISNWWSLIVEAPLTDRVVGRALLECALAAAGGVGALDEREYATVIETAACCDSGWALELFRRLPEESPGRAHAAAALAEELLRTPEQRARDLLSGGPGKTFSAWYPVDEDD